MPSDNSAIDYSKLFEMFSTLFEHDDTYQTNKTITPFNIAGEFAGDFFHSLIFEPVEGQAPIFYSVASPFDLISKKAPSKSRVFQAGEMLLDIDSTQNVDVRTGAMDAYILHLLKQTVAQKKVLYIGAGKVAGWSLRILKDQQPDMVSVDYNAHSEKPEFQQIGELLGVSTNFVIDPVLSEYDYIFIHTNAAATVLDADRIPEIKAGAIITTFISSTPFGELAPEFYSPEANLIVDIETNLANIAEVKIALEQGLISKTNLTFLKDLIVSDQLPDKKYTVFRSGGTPTQDLAMLKLMMQGL